jgi:copper transport protein
MRRLLCLPAALVAAAVLAPAALAHAVLLRTTPADGGVLARSPSEVRLVFDDPVRVAPGNAVVRNGGGSVLRGAPSLAGGGKVLVLPLDPSLQNGDYSVRWRIVSDDGHRESGVLAFAVGAGRAPPVPELRAGAGPSAASLAGRALWFAGLLLAVGTAVFGLWVLRGRLPRPLLLLLAGSLALAVTGAAWLAADAPGGTRFARAYLVGAALAGGALVLAVAALAVPRLRRFAPYPPLALVLVPTLAGHALDSGQPRPLSALADVLHVGAASVWTGGLTALVLTLRRGRSEEVAARFSALAGAAVAVLAATGLVRALFELSAVSQLWSTGYGQALVAKSALLATALGLALVNRRLLLPRGDLRGLARNARVELVLLVGVIAAVAVLTDIAPGKDATAARAPRTTPAVRAAKPLPPPAGAVVLAREDGERAVALAARGRDLTVTVLAPDGTGLSGLGVTVAGRRAEPCGPGCYHAVVPTLSKDVAVRLLEQGRPSVVRFELPAHTQPAGGLVSRATRVFRSLRSVVVHERLASSPTNVLRTRFVMQAPDRLSYRTSAGSEAVVVGLHRWDRTGKGRWVESGQSRLTLPEPFWSKVRDAHVLEPGPVARITFFDPKITAWFDIRVDTRTGRTLTTRMTAASHFMRHRYTDFDSAPAVEPPA